MPKKYQVSHNFKVWLEKHAFKDVLETVIPSCVDIEDGFKTNSIKLTQKQTQDADPEIAAMQGFIRMGSSRDELKKFHIGNSIRELIKTGIDFKIGIIEIGYRLTPENLKQNSNGIIRMPCFFINKELYPFANEYGIETENHLYIPLDYLRSLPYCGQTKIIDNRVFKREKVAERIAKGGITGMVSG